MSKKLIAFFKNFNHGNKRLRRRFDCIFKGIIAAQTSRIPPYRQKVKTDLSKEREVAVALDFSPIEKPHAQKMEGFFRIQKKNKTGQTNGYMMLSSLALGKPKSEAKEGNATCP